MAGKPLIAWTIGAALDSGAFGAVIVSTDDEETAGVARQCGAQVPFLRPSEIAQDETPGIDPVLHALEALPDYDAVMLLQPTSPLRNSEDINGCLALAEDLGAPAVVSIVESPTHPNWMYRLTPDRRLQGVLDTPLVWRRQDLPAVYTLNGAIYYARAKWLSVRRTFLTPETVGYVMPAERSIDVDTLTDWKLAELLLTEHQ